jgi:hypothetical protein
MNWQEEANRYALLIAGPQTQFTHNEVRSLVGHAASSLPGDNQVALQWFIHALQSPSHKWFVAKVMALASPVPRALLDAMLLSGLLEPNPSSNKLFIEPCVKTFGASAVRERLKALASTPGVPENHGLEKALYWVRETRA